MKTTLSVILTLLFVDMMLMCSPKKETSHKPEAGTTTESARMDSFHFLMAETFHPFKDSGNVMPIKMHAEELAVAAEQWANEPIPENIANENTKLKLEQLKLETKALTKLVKTGTDEEIGMALGKLHELFHELHAIWSFEPEEEEVHR